MGRWAASTRRCASARSSSKKAYASRRSARAFSATQYDASTSREAASSAHSPRLTGAARSESVTSHRANSIACTGAPLTDAGEFSKLRAPVCGVFGAEDLQIPPPLVTKFREALEEADIEHEVVSYYGVGHAFWKDVGQVEREEMPVIAGYRLTTTFLKGYFTGKESFAKKRAFLEYQLAQQQQESSADADGEEEESE